MWAWERTYKTTRPAAPPSLGPARLPRMQRQKWAGQFDMYREDPGPAQPLATPSMDPSICFAISYTPLFPKAGLLHYKARAQKPTNCLYVSRRMYSFSRLVWLNWQAKLERMKVPATNMAQIPTTMAALYLWAVHMQHACCVKFQLGPAGRAAGRAELGWAGQPT